MELLDDEKKEIRKEVMAENGLFRNIKIGSRVGYACLIAGVLLFIPERAKYGWLAVIVLAIGAILLCIFSVAEEEFNKRIQWRENKFVRMKEEKELRENEIQHAQDGTWIFPAEEFYNLCIGGKATDLRSEYCFTKAKLYAEQLIEQGNFYADISYFQNYLTRERLQHYIEQGEVEAKRTAQKRLEKSKKARVADATEEEARFIRRADVLASKIGREKRVTMLYDLLGDCGKRICQLREGEEAMMKLAMVYADQQKKEKNWASLGGFAEGIAGPAAGIMVASDAMQDNYEIRKYNEGMRQISMDIMKGAFNSSTDRYKLEKEEIIQNKIEEAATKVILTNPTAQQIWSHFSVGNARVVKNESGVLECSVSLRQEIPFHLDVPNGVDMVVDGTLEGDIWTEGMYVGSVKFPLPLYGISCNTSSEVTIEGMCGNSMEYDGNYKVEMKKEQNLWIMEA